tara:strand:+ start:28214 stop:30313 length:2100 start_codon:yes stop_codon:yes gene_type:complete
MPQTGSTAPYGHWHSDLTAERIFRGSTSVAFLRAARHGVFFLLSLPEEDNTQALMFLPDAGELMRVSPPGMNIRSRVHEYGALPYAFDDDAVYYCNFSDQHLIRQSFDQLTWEAGSPTSLTPTSIEARLRYADFILDAPRQRLICVQEDHRRERHVDNTLVAISTTTPDTVTTLFSGTDFVGSPCLSPDGQSLAFISWNHPAMPWDSTQLHILNLSLNPAAHPEANPTANPAASPNAKPATSPAHSSATLNCQTLQQSRPGSIMQPLFGPDGDLYFIADWSDWWNLYRLPATTFSGNSNGQSPDRNDPDMTAAEPVMALTAEICGPLWQLGVRNYAIVDDNTLLLSVNRDCCWSLCRFTRHDGRLHTLQNGLGALEPVLTRQRDGQSSALYCATTPSGPAQIIDLPLLNPQEDDQQTADEQPVILYSCASPALLPANEIAMPQHLTFKGSGDSDAYGIYYPPTNGTFSAPSDTLPPLLVMVHGGPTSSAKTIYNPTIQFWTQRGFAVFDINHHGSTGYGRQFRHSLYGGWGETDIEDVVLGVSHLINEGLAHPHQLAIRGGSAGGYVVLATLAKTDIFAAGTSYYGISDLTLLARDTHKFESHYLEQMIGPWPQARELYEQRSPINNIASITTPVLMLQGRLDKVVPPNQAEAIFSQIKSRNPASELIYFDDEAHGFRKPANQILALERELAFYRSVLL